MPATSCVVVAFAATLAAVSCAGPYVDRSPGPDPSWPAGEPRIRLVRVVPLEPGGGGARAWFREWTGRKAEGRVLGRAHGLAWHRDALLVSSPVSGAVVRIDPDGKPTFSESGLFAGPMGVAACDVGIVVADSAAGRVALLDDRLRLERWLAKDLDRPTGVACSGDRVYVAETGAHRVVVLGPGDARTVVGSRGTGPVEFNFPTALAVAGGELLVGDVMNFRIQVLEVDGGAFLRSFGTLGDAPGDTPRIKGVTVDRGGHVWVSDAHLDRVSLYDREGRLLLSLGGLGEGPGQFSFPAGLAVDARGRIAVLDSLNRRVQVFEFIDPADRGGG